jgi:hypothetical protein
VLSLRGTIASAFTHQSNPTYLNSVTPEALASASVVLRALRMQDLGSFEFFCYSRVAASLNASGILLRVALRALKIKSGG